jgi:hypothetical protein
VAPGCFGLLANRRDSLTAAPTSVAGGHTIVKSTSAKRCAAVDLIPRSEPRRMSRAFWSVADPVQADGLIG